MLKDRRMKALVAFPCKPQHNTFVLNYYFPYMKFAVPLINAAQQQHAIIETLNERVESLKGGKSLSLQPAPPLRRKR